MSYGKADFSKYDISIAEVHKFKDIVDELSSMVYTEVGFLSVSYSNILETAYNRKRFI